MVITEIITINDTEYLRTYSSEGYTIERDGVEYGEAIDPVGFDRIYTETKNKIETTSEPNEQEFLPNNLSIEEEILFEGLSIEELKEIAILAKPGLTYYKDKYYFDETDQCFYLCINEENEGKGTELYYLPHDLVGAYFKLIDIN